MKKLFLILLLFLFSFPLIAQETVAIDTPYDKEITITIPKDKKDMSDLIVQVSELYWGERYDLEKKLEDEEKLLNQIEELKKRLMESNSTIIDLKNRIIITENLLDEKLKPKIFSWGINLTGGYMFDGLKPTFKGNPYIQLFEVVNIGVEVGYPLQASLQFGILF